MPPSHHDSSVRSLSLRDSSGTLFEIDSQLIRQLHAQGKKDWEAIKNSDTLKRFVEKGLFVRTSELSDESVLSLLPTLKSKTNFDQEDILVAHEKVSFISYPYEWAPEMLKEAGLLTLDLALALSKENLGLKDATPYNVLFSGCRPIFVDLLSVEKRDPKNSLWLAYSQFSKTFINPLLAYHHLGQPLYKTFLLSREGLTATDIFTQTSLLQRLSPALFSQITLPAVLENWNDKKLSNHPETIRLMPEERAKFTYNFFLKSIRKSFKKLSLAHKHQRTQFKHYMGKESPYSKEQFQAKERLVKEWLLKYSKSKVLDVGCNDGHFSRMANSLGRQVVAIDSEVELISKTWQSCRESHPSILPLVINIANPSPASGWKNQEHKSFLERSKGQFDCVLFLAVIHHLLTTESILLPYILDLAKELTTDTLIIEWVTPQDPMFHHLSKGRDYSHLTVEAFEAECKKNFAILEKQPLPGGTRSLYCLKKA